MSIFMKRLQKERMEQRTRRILYGASALEFAILAKTLLAPPASNEELHMFVDEKSKHSTSFRRLWMLFLCVLGGTRLACATSSDKGPSRQLWTFTLFIHLAELCFFYREALDAKEPLKAPQKAFLAILLGLPYLLVTKVPTSD